MLGGCSIWLCRVDRISVQLLARHITVIGLHMEACLTCRMGASWGLSRWPRLKSSRALSTWPLSRSKMPHDRCTYLDRLFTSSPFLNRYLTALFSPCIDNDGVSASCANVALLEVNMIQVQFYLPGPLRPPIMAWLV